MAAGEQIEGLLTDLQTIADTARAGVISKRDEVLEPGETRPAAILFVDIVGFTPLARKLHSEVLAKVVDRTFRIFELTVRAHGGYCDKIIGDAALYVFGGHPNYAPVCEAALKAALKLQDRLKQINLSLQDTGVHLAVRQGVAFGEVTRQAVGAEHAQLTVLGDTVNAAQRLQAQAQPDAILTTVRVLEKAGDAFLHEKLAKMELKGIGAVSTYRVMGVEEQPVQLRGAFRHLSPLIGREAELEAGVKQVEAWLEFRYPAETWDITRTSSPLKGRNRLLLLRGVPATGKSRLAYEIAGRVKAERGAVVATAHCTEHAGLAALTAELAGVAGLTAENLPRRWDELCANAARVVSPEYAGRQLLHLRLLAYVLGCREINQGAIGKSDPKSFAVGCQLAIRACCELAAHEGKPVLLIVEDLQWMGSTKDVIADIMSRACLPVPLVIIGTARPEHLHRPGDLKEGESAVLELDPLTRQQGAAIVQALLPGLKLPQRTADELHEKAAGIPYFYEEFARMLARRRLAVEDDRGWRLTVDIAALEVPEDILALMLGRLDQLDVELREITRRASVLGRSFERSLLAALDSRLGYSHAGHPDDELAVLLAERLLERAEGDRYFFEHVLLREAAYGSLLSVNRRLLHSITADVLAGLHVSGAAGELELLALLIDHLEASGRYMDAHQQACKRLGILASVLSLRGWDELLARAVRLWDSAASGQTTARPPAQEDSNAAVVIPPSPGLHLALAERYFRQGRYPEALEHGNKVLALSWSSGQREIEAAVLNTLGALHKEQGRMEEARVCYEQSLAIFRVQGDRYGEGLTLNNMGNLHYAQGRTEEARSCFEESLAIRRETGDRRGEGITLNNLGNLHRIPDRMEEARACYEESLAIYRELGTRHGEGISLNNLGELHRHQGRMDEARACLEGSLAIWRELGSRSSEGFPLHNLGWLHADLGELDAAITCQREALAIALELESPYLRGICLAHLGRLLAWQGQPAEAAAALAEGTELLGDLRDLYQLALASCSRVYFALANAGYLPRHIRQATAIPVNRQAPGEALAAATEALAKADRFRLQVGAGPESEPARDFAQAREAVVDFAAGHGLSEEAAELIAEAGHGEVRP